MLARHSYTVYIIPIPIVVFLAIAIKNVDRPGPLKFALLAVIAVPVCFAAACAARETPLAARVL